MFQEFVLEHPQIEDFETPDSDSELLPEGIKLSVWSPDVSGRVFAGSRHPLVHTIRLAWRKKLTPGSRHISKRSRFCLSALMRDNCGTDFFFRSCGRLINHVWNDSLCDWVAPALVHPMGSRASWGCADKLIHQRSTFQLPSNAWDVPQSGGGEMSLLKQDVRLFPETHHSKHISCSTSSTSSFLCTAAVLQHQDRKLLPPSQNNNITREPDQMRTWPSCSFSSTSSKLLNMKLDESELLLHFAHDHIIIQHLTEPQFQLLQTHHESRGDVTLWVWEITCTRVLAVVH